MSIDFAALRSHRTVIVSVVVAAVAITAFALVGIAVMMGWLSRDNTALTPPSIASPAQQVAGTATDVALAPGETLVSPPEIPAYKPGPAPMMPSYSPPTPPAPAPAAPIEPPAPRKKTVLAPIPAPAPAPAPAAAPAPTRPNFKRAPPPDGYCVNCATVAAITTYTDAWEVRVRFEDGTSRTVSYPTQPNLRLGDRVRLEDGRLNRY